MKSAESNGKVFVFFPYLLWIVLLGWSFSNVFSFFDESLSFFFTLLFLPLALPVFFAIHTSSKSLIKQMILSWFFSNLALFFLCFIYLFLLLRACQNRVALGCDSEPFSLAGLPLFFGIINSIFLFISSPVIVLAVRGFLFVIRQRRQSFLQFFASDSWKLVTKLTKVAIVMFFVITLFLTFWKKQQWSTYVDTKTGVSVRIPPKEGWFYTTRYWLPGATGIDDIWGMDVFQVNPKDYRVWLEVIPSTARYENGYVLRRVFPEIRREGSFFDKQTVAESTLSDLFAEYIDQKYHLVKTNEVLWKGEQSLQFSYERTNERPVQKCKLIITKDQTLLHACWPVENRKAEHQIKKIIESVILPVK